MIKKLYAVCLIVTDFEISKSFYMNTLGLPLNSQDGKYADFKIGETLLAIFQKSEAKEMFSTKHMNSGGGCVYAYEVDDVEATCKSLMAKGVIIFEGPKVTPWGQIVAYFKDPDNHIWEITEG